MFKIENTHEHPYRCIGQIVGKFGNLPYDGTGCLIGPNIVLTCAHNIYERRLKLEANDMKFKPGINGSFGKTFNVKKAYYPEKYVSLKKNASNLFDFGIL